MQRIVKSRQSLPDIAIQEYGDLKEVYELSVQNNVSVTADLETGQEISCRPGGQIRTELAAKAVSPAAALSEDDVALVPYGGIGLMGIEIDFIVS